MSCKRHARASPAKAYLVQPVDLGTMFGLANLERSRSLGQLLQWRQTQRTSNQEHQQDFMMLMTRSAVRLTQK
jgi:hypothetical protein